MVLTTSTLRLGLRGMFYSELYISYNSVNTINICTYITLYHRFTTCFGSSCNHQANISVKSIVIATKAQRGLKLWHYSFFNLGARRGEWSTPRPVALPHGKRPGTHCSGGWVGPRAGLDWCGKSRLPPGFDHRTVQTVASRYTD